MKVKLISYSESKESVNAIGLKSWNKAGVEIELEDGEDVRFVYEKAKGMVNDTLSPLSGFGDFGIITPTDIGNYETYKNITSQSPLPEIDYSARSKTEVAIDNAETKEQLEALADNAMKYGLSTHFNEKKRTLQQ